MANLQSNIVVSIPEETFKPITKKPCAEVVSTAGDSRGRSL